MKKLLNFFKNGIAYIYNYYNYYRSSLRKFPGMTSSEIEVVKKLLSNNDKIRILEWGCGYSTIYFARYLKSLGIDFEWYGIDNSNTWYEKVLEQLRKKNSTDDVHLFLFDFLPFWQKPNWNWDNSDYRGFEPHEDNEIKYITFPKKTGMEYDLIIVDGRFRRRCLIEAQQMLAQNGFVILHDAQKEHYHSPLSLYKFGKFIESGYLYYKGDRTHAKMWIGSNDNSNLPDMRN